MPPPVAGGFKVGKTGLLTPVGLPESGAEVETAARGIVLDGRYEIEAKLTVGKTGAIYRAKRVMLGDKVAVKIMRPDLVADPMAIERMRRQAQVAARIKHPNSIQIYDFGRTPEGAVYIVEELLSGRTLRDVVVAQRGLTVQRIVNIFNQVCGAVHTAHLNGIVIRDLKPESIFIELTADGKEVAKIGDYGLAKVESSLSGGMTMAAQARLLGTPQYMSPEQWRDETLDSRSDVYSLGIILFELLTGAVPFDCASPMEIAQQHLISPVPDVTDFGRPDLDEGFNVVVSRALNKERNRRQPTALQVAAELQAVSGAGGGLLGNLIGKATGMIPVAPVVIAAAMAPSGEPALPSVVVTPEERGRGAFNPVVLALMAEAFFSKVSSGLIKIAAPLYALLVFNLSITSVLSLALVQGVVPLLFRGFFGTLADKFGKKPIFMLSLLIRTAASFMYVFANGFWFLSVVSLTRGMADSAKGPSASSMIADNTDERHIAKAYAFYNTTKSASGGIGEALSTLVLVGLLIVFVGAQQVTGTFVQIEDAKKPGQTKQVAIKGPEAVAADGTVTIEEGKAPEKVVGSPETRAVSIKDIAIDDLPTVISSGALKKALVWIFVIATVFSGISLILVQIFIKETKKAKSKEKKEKRKEKVVIGSGGTGRLHMPQQQPNVWLFALLGLMLTAPGYMVTGEFFTILATALGVTPLAMTYIKLIAETIIPLVFGPFFGWLADRIGAGKVIALRSIANIVTSGLFWITPFFAGTPLLAGSMGVARGFDEMGKAAFKPTWGAICAKVSSFDLATRGRTMGILEGGLDTADLLFPQVAGILFQFLSLGPLMLVRTLLAILAEIYSVILTRKYRI